MPQRDVYWDVLKGILIILVVLGHVMQLGEERLSMATINLVYSFHMPLFVFVSGFFSHPESKSFKYGILRIAETFVIFQLVRSYIEGMSGIFSIFTPRMALWYLLSLAYWKTMILAARLIRANKMLLLIGSVVLCFTSGLIPLSIEFSFQRTFAFLPFFTMGYILRDVEYNLLLERVKLPYAVALCILASLGASLIGFSLLDDFAGTSYISKNGVQCFLRSRFLILMFGTFMSVSIMRLALELKHSVILRSLGQLTLHIYIYHVFFYMYLLKPLKEYGVIPNTFCWLILYTIVTILILYLTSKIRLLTTILNPFSYLLNIWKTRC